MFRYFLDYGTGWEQVYPIKNELAWSSEFDINDAISRIRLTGSAMFIGDDYTDIITFKAADNFYIPIKVEQNDGTWNTIFDGNANLQTAIDEAAGIITLNDFNNGDDYYDDIIANYEVRYNLKELGLDTYAIQNPTQTTTTLQITGVSGTGYNYTDYKTYYDVNGFQVLSGFTDPRWAYFLYVSSVGDEHTYETMAYTKPVTFSTYTEIRLLRSGRYMAYWVKLPPSVSASESLTWHHISAFNRLGDIIEELMSLANSTVTFTESTAISYVGQFTAEPEQYSWFVFANYQFGEVADIAGQGDQGSDISLKDMFDLMENVFNMYWYVDGTALKFKHRSEIATSGTLDLTTYTTHLDRYEYINNEHPPVLEDFYTLDADGVSDYPTEGDNIFGRFQITYDPDFGDLTSPIRKENLLKIHTNVDAMFASKTDYGKNKFALVETTNNTSSPRVLMQKGGIINGYLTPKELYGHLNESRYGIVAYSAVTLTVDETSLFLTRPLRILKIPTISYYIDLLTDYNMDAEVEVASSGSGRTMKISQRLSSGTAEIDVKIWT